VTFAARVSTNSTVYETVTVRTAFEVVRWERVRSEPAAPAPDRAAYFLSAAALRLI